MLAQNNDPSLFMRCPTLHRVRSMHLLILNGCEESMAQAGHCVRVHFYLLDFSLL